MNIHIVALHFMSFKVPMNHTVNNVLHDLKVSHNSEMRSSSIDRYFILIYYKYNICLE